MVANLSKTIDGVKILDNLTFTLGREDKVAFVGGMSRKNDIVQIFMGEMEPDEGNYKMVMTTSRGLFPEGQYRRI